MLTRLGRGSLVRFALGATGAFAATAVAVGWLLRPPATIPVGSPRLVLEARAGYFVTYVVDASATRIEVSAEAKECDRLLPSDFLVATCRLATSSDAASIGASAMGTLNTVDSPAREAIMWRSVLDGSAATCERGGLVGEVLAACTDAVHSRARTRLDTGVSATIVTPP